MIKSPHKTHGGNVFHYHCNAILFQNKPLTTDMMARAVKKSLAKAGFDECSFRIAVTDG